MEMAFSGPNLVSRNGDGGWTKRWKLRSLNWDTQQEPTKGVDSSRQQDGGHGSRYPPRSV